MKTGWQNTRTIWLSLGLALGLGMAYVWPHERAFATTADRSSQFAMITVPVGQQGAGLADPLDGVFVLDFLTGTLKGAVLSRQSGGFTVEYFRNINQDFGLKPKSEPRYAFASGLAQMQGRGGMTFASGVIYVGELTTGRIIAYSFGWRESRTPILQPQPLVPTGKFQWREPTDEQ